MQPTHSTEAADVADVAQTLERQPWTAPEIADSPIDELTRHGIFIFTDGPGFS